MSNDKWREALASVTRKYPLFSGCGTLANHSLMKLLAPAVPDLVWAQTPNGRIQVSMDDHIGRSIYFFGDLDPKITWILKQLLKPGDHVLDVGANYGLVTLTMSKLVGPNGFVHSFEPNPSMCRAIERTLAANQVGNVRLHALALGSANGELALRVPKGNSGAASLVRGGGQVASVHMVPVVRLDDIASRIQMGNIALMKIDVEGFELDVLKGGLDFLMRVHPSTILFESNDFVRHDEPTPVMKLLHECGYDFLSVPRCIVRMRTRAIDMSRPRDIEGHDFIAIPKGAKFEKLQQILHAA